MLQNVTRAREESNVLSYASRVCRITCQAYIDHHKILELITIAQVVLDLICISLQKGPEPRGPGEERGEARGGQTAPK